MHYLLPIFKWFDASWMGAVVRDSRWIFPAIEAVHIVALALLFGAILMLNLRLLGLTLSNKPVAQLARELAPWVLCSLIIILATGILLFASEALKAYMSVPFRVKMLFPFAAMIFHYTIYSRVTKAEQAQISPVWNKLAAIVPLFRELLAMFVPLKPLAGLDARDIFAFDSATAIRKPFDIFALIDIGARSVFCLQALLGAFSDLAVIMGGLAAFGARVRSHSYASDTCNCDC